ncbi:MAG: hypothetical protein ABR529_00140 [Actinomycetota bacterium]
MRRLASTLVAVALLLAACGGSGAGDGASPKETLSGALDDLRAMGATTATISLRSDPESLQALAAEDGDELSSQDAQKVLDSSLTISSNNEEDPAKATAQVVVNVAGNESIELRMLERTLYLRADVHALLETFGQDPTMADQIAQQAAASGLDFVQPLVEGQWVAVEGLEEALGQGGAAPSAAEQKKLIDKLAASLEESTTVTSKGSDDEGTHLVAIVSIRDVFQDLRDATEGLAQGVPGGQLPNAAEVPDENVELDLWIADGRLTQVEFDFLQLQDLPDAEIPSGVTGLALHIELEEFSGEVEAPDGAVPVDLQKLMQGMFGAGLQGSAPATG